MCGYYLSDMPFKVSHVAFKEYQGYYPNSLRDFSVFITDGRDL
jgi:hypothetical protein